uniref:Vacuolar cation/proton exchanger 5 isoform X4 n=1 Tax=Elaeis guineensis var. tenera TaxID=51953 RepID=A0A8N4EZ22_ELAGV|nr:vacuolar cation/proton exchanger 5 isoform X4 [Elaeis guineensis]
MGLVNGRSDNEFEDEGPVSPVTIARKSLGLDRGQHGTLSDAEQEFSVKYLKSELLRSMKVVLFTAKINILMPCGPVAVLINYLTANHAWVFFLSMLGIIPLAERLGFATEQLAFFTGPTVGGLLNATFGNATELIISIFALKGGMIRVVQQSLLGSILSNMLLVLGCAFFSGGIVFNKKEQVFNKGGSQHAGSLDDEEVAEISQWEAIIWLAILTAWISVLSEYLVDALQGASVSWRIPVSFISVILLPIVGNAAEHASAIIFAMKDKLDISLGVAIGSCTQISMFGIPFCVVIGWIMGQPMDLNFQLFETATLFITVLVVAFMLQDGSSNYFKGLMLILCYLIVAASFYVHVDPASVGELLTTTISGRILKTNLPKARS